jgi:hypothetical protein
MPSTPPRSTATHTLGIALVCMGLVAPGASRAQGLHFGAGVGPTAILEGESSDKENVMGFVGIDLPGPLGVRLEGNETAGFFLLTGNLTLSTPSEARVIRTYLVAGLGAAIDQGEADTEINGGLGLAIPLLPGLRLFNEARVHRLLNGDRSPNTFLPITFGLRVGG